ncbi:pseudouridylate synthase, 23S RNA-specific [Vibrio nigripulchritudo ATCC 27043]|uniref:TIGR01621 family pseudouridine synthase n=1 Tax=Vibrio nigripulchritudo TaxID=28173 RepID=UPI00021C31F8|nr:TIGR01621 family pseudouridine synthase [Vibrio nigripulchritudo]EGU52883.1 pseudouridylate synthase, 23S RNA-specific [Vibrio nigripulchritudo ATCC 27043]
MFDILFTHPDFYIINKHQGISVHKDEGDTALLTEICKVTGDAQLYLIHRLDKMTSGLLIVGRGSQAARELSELFANRNVEKYYLAIGSKKPKKKQGMVMGDMERSRRASWKLTSQMSNPAITQFFSHAGEPGQRIFLCKPHTGKTHQIRVALKSVGSPILGDDIYNPSSHADRGYLHAFALRFEHKGQPFEFVCNPIDMRELGEHWQTEGVRNSLESWNKPWQLNWPGVRTK